MVFRYLKKQGTVIATSNFDKIRINNSLVDYTLSKIISKIIITDNLFGLPERSRRFLNSHTEDECIFFNSWMFFNYICGELMIFNSVDLH